MRPFPRFIVPSVALAALLAVASCGVPTDNDPRAVPSSDLMGSPTITNPAVSDQGNLIAETVYLVEGSSTAAPSGERLRPVPVNVAYTSDDNAFVQQVIETLIGQGSEKGLTNAIPSGTEVLAATLTEDGTELDLVLSREFNDVQGSLQRQAFAQVVFTATAITPLRIDRVRFTIETKAVVAATGTAVTPAAGQPVSRADYPAFLRNLESTTTELGGN